MKIKALKLLLLTFFSIFILASNSSAEFLNTDEYIINFDSDIKVNSDSSMIVTETIKVNCRNKKILRGINRDFPTTYRDNNGKIHNVGFKVINVLRDGDSEPYIIQDIKNGRRVHIGRDDKYLLVGEHEYKITYETNRQIGFFEYHDELYWNVTGNYWDFYIAQATARITLPNDIKSSDIKLKGYTGILDSTQENCESYIDTNGDIIF